MSPNLHPEPTADQRAALDLLAGARSVLLSGHVRPDGDCIGAQAALVRVLEARGQRATVLNPDPPEPQYGYLSSEVPYGAHTGQDLPEHDLFVLLDASELSRLGDLEAPVAAAGARRLVIDHHVLPEEAWWDAAYHDVTASSTGLLVARIASQLGVELDPVAARGVFTSMVTDTGWFRYSNTDAETLGLAAHLLTRGVEPAEMYRLVYQQRPASHPAAIGRLLARTRYAGDGRLALLDLPLEPDGTASDVDTDDVLDIVRSVDRVEVVLLVREVEPGRCKLSARSKTDYDVNRLARRFGGGGHRKASGATLEGPLDEVCARLEAAALEGFQGVGA